MVCRGVLINGKNVLQHIDRLNAIESLALPDGIALSVHQNRLLKLAREGRKMSSRDLQNLRMFAVMPHWFVSYWKPGPP